MRINIEKFLAGLEKKLTDVNTGSYESHGCGEDYFADAENLYEIKEKAAEYCIQFNGGKITYDEFESKLSGIQTEWDTNPFTGFYSFKKDTEPLGSTVFGFSDYLKEYLDE